MGWTERVKEVAKTMRRKAEEELDAVLGDEGEAKDAAPTKPEDRDQP